MKHALRVSNSLFLQYGQIEQNKFYRRFNSLARTVDVWMIQFACVCVIVCAFFIPSLDGDNDDDRGKKMCTHNCSIENN